MSDSDSLYEVIFRGDVVPGQNIVEVKQRLAKLFNAEPGRIDQLFSGRPVALKKHVDQQTAERYRETLHKAGAIVTLQSSMSKPASADVENVAPAAAKDTASPSETVVGNEDPVHQPAGSESSLTMAEVGADVLTADERRDFEPREVDTSALSLSQAGADLLADDEKKPVIDNAIDTSHIRLDSD